MAIYAIGDIQGCLDELQQLLEQLQFDPGNDRLWLAGDLVNRGPQSLETLRFVKGLGGTAITVLGNHDLHLLACAQGTQQDSDPGIAAILTAPDRDELLHWLRHRPLLHHDETLGYTLIHAGLPPQWDLALAQRCATELETVLRSDDYVGFLEHMYGNQPDTWSEDLQGWDRLRFFSNSFTRLRFCNPAGQMALKEKGPPGSQASGFVPWFDVHGRKSRNLNILFGHWSTLGQLEQKGVYALDTGCVWGGQLTALRIDIAPPRYRRHQCPGAQNPEAFL